VIIKLHFFLGQSSNIVVFKLLVKSHIASIIAKFVEIPVVYKTQPSVGVFNLVVEQSIHVSA